MVAPKWVGGMTVKLWQSCLLKIKSYGLIALLVVQERKHT